MNRDGRSGECVVFVLILVPVVVGKERSYPGVMQRIIIEGADKERDQRVQGRER